MSRGAARLRKPRPCRSTISRLTSRRSWDARTILEGVCRALATSRLVTLTGAGGVGKTRLALQVGRRAAEGLRRRHLAGGFGATVRSHACRHRRRGCAWRARAVGLPAGGNAARPASVENAPDCPGQLRASIDACARLVQDLLADVRRHLGAGHESRDAERAGRDHLAAAVPECARSGRGRPGRGRSERNPSAVRLSAPIGAPGFRDHGGERRVGRADLPAAGRPPAGHRARRCARPRDVHCEIAARLDDRFRLLTGGARMAVPRQRTLEATVSWSYELLSEPERVLFTRLAVFAGGWTLDAAERGVRRREATGVESRRSARPSGRALDRLPRTIRRADADRMLETLRQFGRDRLIESGEAPGVRNRHLAWAVGLAETAPPQTGHLPPPHFAAETDNCARGARVGLRDRPR